MLFLGSLSWDIFKKTNESLPAKTITWNFPWFTKLEDKLDIAGIPERPFRKRGHHKYQPCTLSTPPNHVFQNKSNKTDCKTWKKQVANNPHFRPSPSWTIGISSKLVVGVVDDEMGIPCHNGSLVTHGRSRPTGVSIVEEAGTTDIILEMDELTEWCKVQSMIQKCYELLCKTPNHSFRPVHYWISTFKTVKQKY